MIKSIDEYLDQLKTELKDSDSATVQDAMSDAEEHLRTALVTLKQDQPEMSEEEALGQVIEQYGAPDETASAYKAVERLTHPVLVSKNPKNQSVISRFFGVYIDPRTWGSLLYTFTALVTGIIYFTWAVTGVSLSVSLMILIIGVPFAILFLLSVRGLALLEGRLVEALLGERMPRRPLFAEPGLKWGERLKELLKDRHTWFSILYMVLQMPLGIVYFTLNVVLITLALAFMATPFIQVIWGIPVITLETGRYFLPYWSLIPISLGSFLLLTVYMHVVRGIGSLHGRFAKWMLVS